jgi:transposase
MTPRFINLHPRTKKKLVSMRLEAAADGAHRVATRIHAVLLNHEHNTSGEIAKTLKVSLSGVSEWLKIYSDQGVDGLLEGQRSGRPSFLNDEDKTLLCDIIDSGPIAYGYVSGLWTSIRIADVIDQEFGVRYHPGHVRKLLAEFGFSVQSPKRVLARADKEKQAKWVGETYPTIKKKPARNVPASSSKMRRVFGKTQHSTELGHELANNHLSRSQDNGNP